jgi:hypothetical protein
MVLTAETAPPAAAATPKAADDPVSSELDRLRRELADARLRLLEQLGKLQLADEQSEQSREQLASLKKQHGDLDREATRVGAVLAGKGADVQQVVASAAELKKRGEDVLKQIKALEKLPPQKQVLRYHTPVSRAVHADEMFFECRHGRITFIDLPAFMQEVHATLDDRVSTLRTQWQVSATTAPAGPFRLHYTVEREKGTLEGIGGGPQGGGFRYGLSEWTLEPITENRGETLDVAMRDKSEFRKLVDRLDPQITVVTFWVYPDSFELFRRVRDHLYERGIEVAGRPLSDDSPIAASRSGTASRGQ